MLTVFAFWMVLVTGGSATAQPGPASQAEPSAPPANGQPAPPSAEELEQRLADIESSTSLEETVKAQVSEQLRDALAQVQRATDAAQRAAELRQQTAAVPEQLRAIREEPPTSATADVPADATLSQLEQRQQQVVAELATARELAATLQTESQRRQTRRSEIADATSRLRQQLTDIAARLTAAPAASAQPAIAEAQRSATLARQAAIQAELDALEAEVANLDARRDAKLLAARVDQARSRVTALEGLAQQWQEVVSTRRQRQAEREADALEAQAQDQTIQQTPSLRAFAERTTALAEARSGAQGLPARIAAATEQIASDREAITDLRSDYASMDRRVRASGLNRATGLLLRQQFEALPDVSDIRRRLAETRNRLELAEFELIERQEQRLAAGDIDGTVASLLNGIPSSELTDGVRAAASEVAVSRRDLLDSLVTDAATYFEELIRLEDSSLALVRATEAYESYIRERVLWVRSIPANQRVSPEQFVDTLGWFARPEVWNTALSRSVEHLQRQWAVVAFGVVVLVGLGLLHARAKRRIAELGGLVIRYRTDSMRHTLFALILTFLTAILLPAILWSLGWLLHSPVAQEPAAIAVGRGLQHVAWYLVPLLLVRQVLRPKGLSEAHFRWSAGAAAAIRRHLRWFLPITAPLVGLLGAIDAMPTELRESANATVGRVGFTIAMLALAVLVNRILRPKGAVIGDFVKRNSSGWVERLRLLWYPALILLPVGLVIASWLGFDYTARQLEHRFEQTLGLILLVVLVNAVLMRWLFFARRQVAIDDARRRREAQIADAAKGPGVDVPAEGAAPAVDEDKLDLPGISGQTKQLFRTAIAVWVVLGLYGIWADVLPALRMLDRVEVWPQQRIVEEVESSELPILEVQPAGPTQQVAAEPRKDSSEQTAATTALPGTPSLTPTASAADDGSSLTEVRVTLADLGLALVILIATFVAFRNLPGLVEIAVLQRLPLDAGSRYALATVLKYIIGIIGGLAAFGAVGIAWDNVQWLAAALTFGLAFGLQEIFANFVSGLIILAERPIRVGDTVTVGSVSGTVSRIRMRATTVTDWDRKDLVIPNKTFVTGDVINWTLSDTRIRLIVPVGVAYGSDVQEVESILRRISTEATDILTDPKPYVLFSSFGDSTLNFELRVFLPHVDRILAVKHDLHMRITKAFRDAGVEIAFPQRDLHIRDLDKIGTAIGQQVRPKPAPKEPEVSPID